MNSIGCRLLTVVALLLAAGGARDAAAAGGTGVLTFHNSQNRSGMYVVPGLDWARARRIHLDAGFQPQFPGNLYAQPLYWLPNGAAAGELIVATESNVVAAIDAGTGKIVWQRTLGQPVPRSALLCGNIDPVGITGTPVIDAATGTLYLDAYITTANGPRHQIFALSLSDGSTLAGWPVDVAAAVSGFNAPDQNQRPALALFDGRVYVAYGGHWGDCGNYHGWVVGVRRDDPSDVVSWATRAKAGGIWGPGGIVTDTKQMFVGTGNTMNATGWQDGEAVIRLREGLRHSENLADFFTPRDWATLDAEDLDLSGSNPMPLDVPMAGGTSPMILSLGKDGNAYLLDRNDLGGIAHPLAKRPVSGGAIITSPAAYPAGGGIRVAFQGGGLHCPSGGKGLTVLQILAGPPPRLSTVWCAALNGAGSPIVTTSDGSSDPIVWITGAEGDNELHGFRGDNGQPLVATGAMTGLRHFETPLVVGNRIYVGADGRLYAFAF
jgi:hypothetical protein